MAISYTPDPTDPTQPLDDIDASTAAAEFRALKAYLAGLTLGNQNAALYRKNLLDNPTFSVKQRLSGAGLGSTDFFVTDRWKVKRNYSANVTGTVLTGAMGVLNPAAGNDYLSVGAGAIITAPTAGQVIGLEQGIEFANIDNLGLGTANAKEVTLSFWVYASTTGYLPIYFQNLDRTRSYVTYVQITSATTWTFFSVSVALDTTGTWAAANPNALGLIVGFSLEAGTSFQTVTGYNLWQAGDFRSHSSQTRWLGTNGNVVYLHMPQLEIGGAYTTFEKRSLALEQAICARYFERSYDQNLTAAPTGANARGDVAIATVATTGTNRLPFRFTTRKRTLPTMAFPSVARSITAAQDGGTPTLLAGSLSEIGGIANCAGGSSLAVGHAVTFPWVADADF